MSANDRIIRDEKDEDGIFDAPRSSVPRIDLILGVGLAVVASVLGLLSSFGIGAINAGPDLTTAERPVAAAPAQPDTAPIVMRSTGFDEPLFSDNALGDDLAAFELVEAPLAAAAPRPIVIDQLHALDNTDVIIECVSEGDAPDDPALSDRQRVVRMFAAAARLAADDAEVDAAIDELRITVESLVERAECLESTRDSTMTGPTALRVPTLRIPRFDRGL